MKKTIYLHVGTHKTGTTSIQRFLYANSKFLNLEGFDYLVGNCVWQGHHPLGWGFQGAMKAINKYCPWNHYGVINRLEDEIASSPYDNFIISSENLFLIDNKPFIDNFFARFTNFNFKVIVYLREQVSFLESWYLELIKADYYKLEEDFEQFIENPRYNLDYYSALKKWEDYVGKENLHVFNFKEESKNGNLLLNFSKTIGLKMFDSYTIPLKANEKISYSQMIELREVNRLHLSYDEWYKAKKEILDIPLNDVDKTILINDELKEEIRNKCYDSNQKLKKSYNISFN